MRACVPALLRKLIKARPNLVAFVGMGICEVVLKKLRELEGDLQIPPLPPLPIDREKEEETPNILSSPKIESKPSLILASPKSPGGKRKKAVIVKCGIQPLTITLPSDIDGKYHTIYFYALPSTSARVVTYQVAFLFFLSIEAP